MHKAPNDVARLALLTLDALAEPMVVCDGQWQVLLISASAEQFLAISREQTVGRPLWDLPGFGPIGDEVRRHDAGQGWASPLRIPFPAGRAGEGEVVISRRVAGEDVIFLLILKRAAPPTPTDRSALLAQKHQAIGALASGVAHDFNNVLTAIISHLELATLSPNLPPPVLEHLGLAQTSARRGAELVGRLLAFSRQTTPRLESLQPEEVAEEVLAVVRRTVDPRIQVCASPRGQSGWPVLADRSQFMQVLMNLCLNARDAMPEGGRLEVAFADLSLEPRGSQPARAGDFVRLGVSDTGQGISPDVLARVFEPYFTTKNFGKGTGLGLSICHSIIAQHGGWMEVESEVGRGSRFYAFLPRATSNAGAPPAAAEPMATGSPRRDEGRERLLVVDDDELVRLVMRAVLTFRGYQVVEAVNGEEAVTKYQEENPPFDLVLLDIHMPRLNGWEALARIRQVNPQAKVLLISGGPTHLLKEKAQQLGVSGLLGKPFDNQDLARCVRRALDDPSAETRLA